MQNTTASRCLTILGLVLSLAMSGTASGPNPKPSGLRYEFHTVVPLGIDALELQPAGKTVYLMASAESAQFEGLVRSEENGKVTVTGPDGAPVEDFPESLDFRVTASGKRHKLPDGDAEPFPVAADTGLDDYLLGFQFRLLVFDGIEGRVLEPDAVRLIGVPADVPYDERIYRVTFDLGKLSLQNRLVLEVMDPDGNRISKFHLDVY